MFWGNTAGEKSLALQGSAAVILNNVSFVNNTIHCAFGDYSYEDTLGEVSHAELFPCRGRAKISTPISYGRRSG